MRENLPTKGRRVFSRPRFQAWLEIWKSADEVLADIKARNIKGIPNDCAHCLVARWIRSYWRAPAYVGNKQIDIRTDRVRAGFIKFPLPRALASIVIRFDRGRWPDLIVDGSADRILPTN
jgi:hypothetical protein